MTDRTEAALDLLSSLVLDNGRRWGDMATSWQWRCASTLLDATAPPNRWESRPRGGSKTTDQSALALIMLVGVLPAGSECHVYARDLDQAKRIRDFADGFVRRTPGLSHAVTVDRLVLRAKSGSTLTIESADAASAYGQLSAFTIVDELCQWPETDNSRTLWEAISSGMGKVPGARLVVITTSGDPGSWSHGIYRHALKSARWTVQDVPGPLDWADPAFIADQRLELPPSAFARLHLNQWTAGEDRLTTAEDLEQCVTLGGPLPPAPGRRYVVTADLGFVKDASVVAVMHSEPLRDDSGEHRGHRFVLDQLKTWRGTRRNPVRLADVEAQIQEWCRLFQASALVDPHEAVGSIQELREKGVKIDQYTFTAASVGNLGLALYQAIKSHRLAIWRDQELIDELLSVKLVEKTVGSYRLDHASNKHDDMAVALALGIVALDTTQPGGRPVLYTAKELAEHAAALARQAADLPAPQPLLGGTGFAGDTSTGHDLEPNPNQGRTARSPFVA